MCRGASADQSTLTVVCCCTVAGQNSGSTTHTRNTQTNEHGHDRADAAGGDQRLGHPVGDVHRPTAFRGAASVR